MPYADIEAKRRVGREHYWRKVAADPQYRAKAAARARTRRAGMSAEDKAAILAKRAVAAREARRRPEVAAKNKATCAQTYSRYKVDPKAWAHVQNKARQRYWANLPWRAVQNAALRAKKRGLAFDLTKEWVASSWTGLCALSGLDFVVGSTRITPFSPSLDRIDNNRGYTQDNCRFILFGLNAAKCTGTDADLLAIAKAMVAKHAR